jgi:nicotinamidase/pyrazinamidase
VTNTPFRWGPETALLIVDVQNDFAHPRGSLYVRGGEEIVSIVNRLVADAQAGGSFVVYSKDWHPRVTPHFRTHGGVWPEHCVRNTWGAEFLDELAIATPAVIVHKGTGGEDGYSAFTMRDPSSEERRATGLDAILRQLGVRTLVIVGIATDYCVRATTLDAIAHGFEPVVLAEAVRAVDLQPGDGARALEEMAARGARVVSGGAARSGR